MEERKKVILVEKGGKAGKESPSRKIAGGLFFSCTFL
jgi:hypothetical protein